ncbi:MAG: AAA family ATPase [Candidatus Sericytochromatia bacterium]|nr:AAA family ATPase [Candidatus Sericytochromatia bacterium]
MCSAETSLSQPAGVLHSAEARQLCAQLQKLQQVLNQIILGKQATIEKLLSALLAQGHVLLEDIPGIGKTTLAKAFSEALDCTFRRIQFTPDLLPSDVLGTAIYHPAEQRFHFQEGPVFTHILMADEINRASPRAQSSLLEAMAEQQVTVDGRHMPLPSPFMVIATQNPLEYHGTYPLPEAQLDRFMMQLELGYPEPELELSLLLNPPLQHASETSPFLNQRELLQLQALTRRIFVAEDLGVYILKVLNHSRQHPELSLGISPRGGMAWLQAARGLALLRGRHFVKPVDLADLAIPVLAHRLLLRGHAERATQQKQQVLLALLEEIAPPRLMP